MKFSTAAASFLLVASAQAFAPASTFGVSKSALGKSTFSGVGVPSMLDVEIRDASSSTELQMGLRTFLGLKKSAPKDLSDSDVRDLFSLWNDALATGSSATVAKRYSSDPILLPTVSDTPRTDVAGLTDYFDAFLQKKPQGVIVEGQITRGDNWCMDAGIYDFTMGVDGSVVRARYSFVYVYEGGEWKIQHHHSSVMPEGVDVLVTKDITENQVRNLFYLWNDALATEDPETVAGRYSKQGVLLPTVSDVPRTDKEGLVDYFTGFCKKQPQGKILESNVIIGTNWCQDAGIYEFTMGADGSKVKARYSFIYVHEDGAWKISHHHSSMMPEGTLPQAITKEEVRAQFGRWNDALATLDSRNVADRYSKNAVLLPTVSDTPRTDDALIKDYFDAFLLKKPQGVILEGDIIIGHNWAQDAGIYEFTMGATGDKVKARYSYVYVFEDGDWKISHHHSSVMPEAFLGPAKPAEEKEAVSA